MASRPRARGLLLGLFALASVAIGLPRRTPGFEKGSTLLTNGWRIAPAGRHLSLGDLPLAMAESPDGPHLVVTNNGYAKPTLTIVDLARFQVQARVPVTDAWLGLVWSPGGDRLYSSGGSGNEVLEFEFRQGSLKPGRRFALPLPGAERSEIAPPASEAPPAAGSSAFVGGVCTSLDGSRLFAVNVLGQALHSVDVASGKALRGISLEAEPYSCAVSKDGATVFVSLWGCARI